jgi:hypothetical protein
MCFVYLECGSVLVTLFGGEHQILHKMGGLLSPRDLGGAEHGQGEEHTVASHNGGEDVGHGWITEME